MKKYKPKDLQLTNKVIKNRSIYDRHQSWPATVWRSSHNSVGTIIAINFPSKIQFIIHFETERKEIVYDKIFVAAKE